MSVLQKLTLRHLRLNRKRTVITLIGIILSVAMVTAVSGLVVSFQDLLYRDSIEEEGLWHVRYSGVSPELAEQIVREPVFSEWEWIETEDGPVLSLQFARLSRRIFDQSEEVCRKYGVEQEQVRYHNNLLIAKGIVPGAYYTTLYSFAAILLGLIAVGSVLVISNAFTISSDQRSLQFGLLKSTGATKRQIRGMVLFEGIVLAAVAIPLGILAGFFAQWVALTIANRIIGSMITVSIGVPFRVIVSPGALAVTVAAALLTVLLAAWFPAQRAANSSAIEAIRQTRSIKLTDKNVRVLPLTGRLFGFEGMLAAKSMARSRGKYRTTILALVVSIVLFIGVSSFANILLKATTLFYDDMGSNVVITLYGDTARQHDELVREIQGWDVLKTYPSRDIVGATALTEGSLTKEYREYFPDETPLVRLFSVGGEQYGELCRQLKISPDDSGEEVSGILVNTSGTYIVQGRRINFVPYRLTAGDSVPITVGDQAMQLTIAGTVSEIPPGIYLRFSTPALNVIVSDETIARLWPEGEDDFLWLSVLTGDAAGFAAQARAFLEQELPPGSFSIMDYDNLAANNRNIGILVMIFVYGFIAMLTLIGVTSVVATISTNIALRAREFAMLRSVGMTEPAITKMLRYESLLYGVKALLWGIPLGLFACFLLYQAMTSGMDFPFIWPVESICISVVAILLITFSTMAFARRKQRQMNIVDVLRDDVV